jgi:hypothetical protein
MKIPTLFLAVLAIAGALATTRAAGDKDWAAKGYRWSLVSGPYAYISKDDAKNDRSRRDKKSVSETIRHAYYLRPGKVVLVIATDAAAGLTQIRMGGIGSDLWTATKNLSTRPVKNSVGKIETPETAGILIPTTTQGLSSSAGASPTAGVQPSSKSSK